MAVISSLLTGLVVVVAGYFLDRHRQQQIAQLQSTLDRELSAINARLDLAAENRSLARDKALELFADFLDFEDHVLGQYPNNLVERFQRIKKDLFKNKLFFSSELEDAFAYYMQHLSDLMNEHNSQLSASSPPTSTDSKLMDRRLKLEKVLQTEFDLRGDRVATQNDFNQ